MGTLVLAALICGLAAEQRTHNELDNEVTRGREARCNLDWHTEEAAFCRTAQDRALPYDIARNVLRQAHEKATGVKVDPTMYRDWATEQARHEQLIRFHEAEVKNTPRRKQEVQRRLIIPFSDQRPAREDQG